jgi:hypothetical protein
MSISQNASHSVASIWPLSVWPSGTKGYVYNKLEKKIFVALDDETDIQYVNDLCSHLMNSMNYH